MSSLGTCQPSVKKEVVPKPRQKQPLPVSMADLLAGQCENGRKRRFGTTPSEIASNFMALIDKQDNGCWMWRGAVNKSRGYGVASFGRGRGFLAHRVSHVLFIGSIPLGKLVLHKCDVRLCVNPGHFFLGTDTDNARDSMLKFRKPSKLTSGSVRKARHLYKKGMSQRRIAEMLGVTQPNISHVLRGNTWAHVK